MDRAETTVQAKIFALQDLKYRDFQCKLVPGIAPETIIGVRTPQLRALAKELSGTSEAAEFFRMLPHKYYDENNLHGFLLERVADYGDAIALTDEFLPYVDNWATCDLTNPKVFKKHLPELLEKIKKWLSSEHTYTVRFGLELLMRYFLDASFCPEYLELAAELRSDEYYINMMVAWFFATALAKQYDAALHYIENRRLDTWTHNKTIQKSVESFRITDEQKAYLRTLRIK